MKVGTGVGGELFVALGFVSLLHLVKRCADERIGRMEYPLTLGASEARKVRALNPVQTARHCRIISQNNAWSRDRGKWSLFRGGCSATSVFTTEQTRIVTASIILLRFELDSERCAMKYRVAIWATAGFLVASRWAVYFFVRNKDLPIEPQVSTLVRFTCPVAIIGRHYPVSIYLAAAANVATYALVGLAVEILRRQFNHSN